MDYHKRIADKILNQRLEAFGAILLEGPKWCGKTTTAMQQAASLLQMQNPDYRDGYMATANTKPSLLLQGPSPRLIDEWQVAPVLWDAVRVAVDNRGGTGHFILTGSNSFNTTKIMHTGTGRISRLKMYTMSLWESGESNGTVSLSSLFENPKTDIDGMMSGLSIEQIIEAACRGGWPATLSIKNKKAKRLVATDYIESICNTDIKTVDGTQRNPVLTRLILRTYARNIATLAKKSVMVKDILSNVENLSMNTFDDYVNALKKLFVIEDIEAWCPAVRSATVIRSGMKRCFTDPSIAVAALGLTPEQLQLDLKTFGFIFEVMCIRDLRAYSQGLGGILSYYHDRYGLEADAVLHLPDGRFALIEFKLGSREIEEGATHLLKLKQLISEYNKSEKQMPMREPDLLIIITGGQMAYTRADGVKIIPIGCLRG